MKHHAGKTFIVSLVSLLTISFGATPALATPYDPLSTDTAALAAVGPQVLNTVESTTAGINLDAMLEVVNTQDGPKHSFNVAATIAAAEAEIGTSRATGWGMPGECIISAKRWVHAGGGNWYNSGSPVSNYDGATRLPYELVEPGDIIQYENLYAPHAWVSGVHTVLVTGVNDDGTLTIIESNIPFGSGYVQKQENWTPQPPAGFQAVVWRF